MICPKCQHDIQVHSWSEDFCGCEFANCGCKLQIGSLLDEQAARITALEARLKEAEAVIKEGVEELDFGGNPKTAIGHAIVKWRSNAAFFLEGGSD